MAFVARRNNEGKLVDCQVISGHGTSSVPISDLSDEDTDSGTVQGYSDRSYISPTVRYVANKEDEEQSVLESCYNYDGTHDSLDTGLQSVVNFCDRYNDCGEESDIGDAQDTLGDYYEPPSDEETIQSNISEQELDEKTVIMPRCYTAGGGDADAYRELQKYSGFDAKMRPEDALSISSFDEVTVCHPDVYDAKMKPEDVLSLGSVDSATVCCDMNIGLSLDSLDKLDNLDTVSNKTDCQSQRTNRTYNLKSSTVRRDDCSSASTCSWTDMYGGALKASESHSNIVPSLSLNMSVTSSGSSTYFRTLDKEKEQPGQGAYQEWVKRKELQKQQKQQAAKKEQEKRDAESAMRQRLAKERYEQWCRQKEHQQKKQFSTGSVKSAVSTASYNSYPSSSSGAGGVSPNDNKPPRVETPEARKKRLAEWERIKTKQQQRERERQRQQEERKVMLEQQRKQKSEGAWQNWMKSVGKRPKPVPLNQGMDTLRGTVSNMYVNPIQWVSNIDPNDSRGN